MILLITAGLGARAVEASKSLWLDELHTTELGREPSLRATMEHVARDIHPPLYFILVRVVSGFRPEHQRWLSIVFSLIGLGFLVALLERIGVSRRGRLVGAAVYLLAPYQLRYGVELRPYALLECASLAIVWAGLGVGARPSIRLGVFALATAVGLNAHHLAAVPVVAVGLVRLIPDRRDPVPLWKLILAGALGVAAFMPWILHAQDWLIHSPGELNYQEAGSPLAEHDPRHDFLHHKAALLQLLPRLLVPSIESLGSWQGLVAGGGLVLLLSAFAWAVAVLCRRAIRGEPVAGRALRTVAAGLFSLGITAVLCIKLWEKLRDQYMACGAWFWPVAFAWVDAAFAAGSRASRIFRWMVGVGLLLAAIGHLAGAPREELRTGVDRAVALAREKDAHLTAVMRQPDIYDAREVYRVYAPEAAAMAPLEVPEGDGRPVVVLTRATVLDGQNARDPRTATIRAGRKLTRKIPIDPWVTVWLFER